MSSSSKSSRSRFNQFKTRFFESLKAGKPVETEANPHKRKRKPKSEQRSFKLLFKTFWNNLSHDRTPMIVALCTLTIATMLKLGPPAAIKFAIDYIFVTDPIYPEFFKSDWGTQFTSLSRKMQLFWVAILSVGISLVASVIHLYGRWFATRTVNRMQIRLRKRVFEHVIKLPLSRIQDMKSGNSASLLREDAGGAAELVFSLIYNPWRAIIQLIGSLVILMFVDYRMMLGGLGLIPVIYFSHRVWIRRIRPLWRIVRSQRELIDGHATETFGGMRIVRSFVRERLESQRYVTGNHLLVRKQLYVWWMTRIIEFMWDVLVPVVTALILFYGGWRIIDGSMTLGDLTLFLFYLVLLLEPLATLVASAARFQNNLAGFDRILDILDEPGEFENEKSGQSTGKILDREEVKGELIFDHVDFKYAKDGQPILSDIDLKVAAGETIALVGHSGAGKTTLCNLIARFFDPVAGRILFDGVDLKELDPYSFRKLFGIVEQEVFLFDGTIRENIAYGRHGASQDEIVAAAKAAHCHGFIMELTDGYEAIIGERGVKLSGGQKQRLAIARALISDPRILILDEATSSLDSENEMLVQQSLKTLVKGRTCFVIAHRMSTVRLADRIAVLDHGKLVALDNHEALMETSEIYRQMVLLQTADV